LKVWAKKAFHLRALSIVHWESNMLQSTYFISVESMPSQHRKAVFSNLSTVFGWAHFATQYITCCVHAVACRGERRTGDGLGDPRQGASKEWNYKN